jgi:alpha-amylase
MNSVIDLGVAGFRVDAAKHVQEADLADIISRLHNVPEFGGRPDIFHEVYGDATIPYTAYVPLGKVTNFDYQRTVSSGFQGGNIAQFANLPNYGGLTGSQAIVFVDNHDTQRSMPTLTYKNGDRYYLADAFMMAHPYGTVQLMSSYAFGSVVGQGPPSSSNGTTNATTCGSAWICEHRNEQVAGMPSFRNATEGTGIGSTVTDGNGRLAFARAARGYAAFNATDSAWTRTFTTSLPDGSYCNVARGTFRGGTCTGGVITVSGGSFTTTIPANRGVALHVNARTTGSTATVPVAFNATVTTWFGQNVFVAGSTPELGSWNPANAVALSATDYPVWKATVALPTGQPIEYKLIKKDPDGTVTWEAGANRTYTPAAAVTLTSTWR